MKQASAHGTGTLEHDSSFILEARMSQGDIIA